MTLTEIPRERAGCVTSAAIENNSERAALAKEAASKLKYTMLDDDVHGRSAYGKQSGPLTEALLKLEIDVLNTEAVLRYQMAELTRRTMERIKESFEAYTTGWFAQASWSHQQLQSYKQPIPEFVIRKAIQIADACPEVTFFVQSLTESPDPFLIARVGEEVYYIEAWAEPRFEESL